MEKPLFCYTNRPIIRKKQLSNIQGWGTGRCLEVTYDDGDSEKVCEDTEFFTTPQLKFYSKYIVRKSKPSEILEIYERMENGYIVWNMKGEAKGNYYYIPKYTDLLSLGYNKDYKHPDLTDLVICDSDYDTGYNQALQDQISHLQKEIIKIKE